MVKRVFVAEKPTLGRAIAAGLGRSKSQSGYIECGDDVVTWCFGHLLELAPPKAYKDAWAKWRADTLPIIPERFKKEVKADKGVKAQLKVIKELLSQAQSVVHAGDPDREGQLLVDEVLTYLGWSGPTQRIWLSATHESAVERALGNLLDNASKVTLSQSASTRSVSDWLIGLNMTRAATIAHRRAGGQKLLSLGRVQTPTLALVVRRDEQIENFTPHDYYTPYIDARHSEGDFRAYWLAPEQARGLDDQGRLVDESVAGALASKIKGQSGVVESFKTANPKSEAPLPFNLSALQKAAGRFNLTAQQTLKAAQNLYEDGVTSYPRTDCRYLQEDQLEDAPQVLEALAGQGWQAASGADSERRHKAWNSSKVTAHHALMPTGQPSKRDGHAEEVVYRLICQSFIQLFYPPQVKRTQKAVVKVDTERFSATGARVVEPGWTAVTGKQSKETELPEMNEGDTLTIDGADYESAKTKPPPRWTDATLVEAMTSVHRYVEDDNPKVVARLRETSGLGTEATRAAIIEVLIRRGYIKRVKKKQLISTTLGRDLIAAAPSLLASPATTALWEDALKLIEEGKAKPNEFLERQKKMLPKLVKAMLEADFPNETAYLCGHEDASGAICREPLRRLRSKKTKRFFWACPERSHPLRADNNGKPGEAFSDKPKPKPDPNHPCPKCNSPMVRRQSRKGTYWWGCSAYPDCKHTEFEDDNRDKKNCPSCGEQSLIRLESKRKEGVFFWVCTASRSCPLRGDNEGQPGEAFDDSKKGNQS